jgi:c-di-GMP-binding flagellar brake protein YcgR
VTEQRRTTRYRLAASITVKLAERTLEGQTLDLSLGGIRIALDERLAMGTKASLSFRVPGHADPIEVDGEVRWSSDSETGFQFGSLRARDVWELNRYFESV